jgi:hypothetical protein
VEAVHGEVFNVGDDAHNYRVRDIATIVAGVFPGCEVSFGGTAADNRSYRVGFGKIHRHLPGFRCAWDAAAGARQLRALFERIAMPRDVFEFRAFTRLKQIRHLLDTGQIDTEYFWTRA